MQIILVSNRLAAARTIHIKIRHIVAVFGAFLLAIFLASATLSWLSIQWRWPLVQDFLRNTQDQETRQSQQFVTDNLQALAAQLGELQARMVRLDGLGAQLSAKTGIAGGVKEQKAEPQGGPFVPAPLTENSLQEEINRLAAQIEAKSTTLAVLEDKVRAAGVRREFLPTTLPVAGGARLGSSFGIRLDPLGRGRAMHEGLDFVAPHGTPVVAAAGGVVVNAAYHPEFGNLVEVNHGGELITRYAHLSAMNVTVGTAVRAGDHLGALGNTGRSTGPHLHFEVKENGLAIDPAAFLRVQLAKSH